MTSASSSSAFVTPLPSSAFTSASAPSRYRPSLCRRPARPAAAPSLARPSHMTLATPPTASSPLPAPPARDGPSAASAATLEPVREIDGVDEYLDTLHKHRGELIVLKIFAPWCRSCRALTPKLNRLCREFPTVTFVKLDYERNKELCRRLGVVTMPTFIFYSGAAGEVEKFSCGPARAHVLRQKVVDIMAGVCELPEEEGPKEKVAVPQQQNL